MAADARVVAEHHSGTPSVASLAATAEPTSSKRTPSPISAATVRSGELPSSRSILVRLAAVPGAAANATPSRSTLRNPASVARAAAESVEPAASKTICVDVGTCRAIQSPKSVGAVRPPTPPVAAGKLEELQELARRAHNGGRTAQWLLRVGSPDSLEESN